MTVSELFEHCRRELKKSENDDFDFEARLITQKACKLDYGSFLLEKGRAVTEREKEEAENILSQRLSGRPLQYILGEWDFMGLTFAVGEGVLIPRPETEQLVEIVVSKIKDMKKPIVFDLCSGSGCIGLSIKHFVKQADVYLIELSDEAIHYLEKNRIALDLARQVPCIKGDILGGYDKFSFLPVPDVIVSNPPYIETALLPSIQKEVRREPKAALDGGEDGLVFYRALSKKWLAKMKSGFIAVECGENQARQVGELFLENGNEIEIVNDFNGIERFVICKK